MTNQYDLTFNDIYESIENQYLSAEREYRLMEKREAFDEALEKTYLALTDFYTTLVRFKEQPEYKSALEHAVNDFNELRDGFSSYVANSPPRGNDKVLEVLGEAVREKWSDVCALFDIPTYGENANTLRKIIRHRIRKEVSTC